MTDDDVVQKANMAVVRRLLEEGFGQGMVKGLPNQIAADYVGHLAIGDHFGPDGVRIDIHGYHTALSNISVTVEDLFSHGDRVARRFTLRGTLRFPLPPDSIDGPPIVLNGIAIDRLKDGLLVESWIQMDRLPEES
jgi:predicted ester cyclase